MGFSATQGTLSFKAVNGEPIRDSAAPVCVPAGKHVFNIRVETDFRKMDGNVELELKPDRSYWLRAKLTGRFGFGGDFDFTLMDVSDNKQVTVSTFSTPAQSKSFNFILIPGSAVPILMQSD